MYNMNTILCLQLAEYHFGTKRYENPIEHVYFYYKSDPNVPVLIKREQVSFNIKYII